MTITKTNLLILIYFEIFLYIIFFLYVEIVLDNASIDS